MRRKAALLALLGGCTFVTDSFVTNDFSGDPFPTLVDTSSGAILVGFQPDGFDARVAVLDVFSPFTVIDPGLAPDGTVLPASISTASITLLARRESSAPGVVYEVPRARLVDKTVMSLHPCPPPDASEASPPAVCAVGPDGSPVDFNAIVGSEALAGDALRLRLGEDTMFLLADVGGTDVERTYECDAVFPEPYRGGGRLDLGGTQVDFTGRRVTLQACLAFAPTAAPQTARGADILAVLSTGTGISLLGASAYERYRLVVATAPPLDSIAEDASVFLTSGKVTGKRVTIDSFALVGAAGSGARAPCRQVYAHHFLTEGNCEPDEADCPCNDSAFCSVPAVVEVGTPVEMLVISDQVLAGIRTELRPDQAEVDAILGTDAIRALEVDIDYPHDRVLMRCAANGAGCTTRPALAEEDRRARTDLCIAAQQPTP